MINGALYLKGAEDKIYDRETEEYLGVHNMVDDCIDMQES